jgi:protoporphyrinogen IX oxidase
MLWWKAIHIVFVIAWFAGLFYLPRLFVYHADTHDAPGDERFKVMERRLFILMTIAALGTLVSGAWLAFSWWRPFPLWLHAKLALVAALLVYHALCWRHLRAFAAGSNASSSTYYRVFNEVPTLLLIASVLLVVLKPS